MRPAENSLPVCRATPAFAGDRMPHPDDRRGRELIICSRTQCDLSPYDEKPRREVSLLTGGLSQKITKDTKKTKKKKNLTQRRKGAKERENPEIAAKRHKMHKKEDLK